MKTLGKYISKYLTAFTGLAILLLLITVSYTHLTLPTILLV